MRMYEEQIYELEAFAKRLVALTKNVPRFDNETNNALLHLSKDVLELADKCGKK